MFLHYRRQEELQANREEIDRQRKLLMKRKPVEGGSNSRKRGANSNQGGNLPNGLGGDHDHRDLTIQEYYESEEILKVHCTGYYFYFILFFDWNNLRFFSVFMYHKTKDTRNQVMEA